MLRIRFFRHILHLVDFILLVCFDVLVLDLEKVRVNFVPTLASLHSFTRLKRTTLAGFEVLCNLLLIFAAIRFGPKIWGALQIFGIQHASQSGCKLVAYTEYGIRHVEIVVLSLLVLYVWLAMRRQYDLDDKIRSNLAWLLLSLLAIEGVTGMVPAMYTDIGFVGSQYQCDFGEPNEGNDGHYVVMEMLFSTLLPYVIPSIVLLYPLLKLTRLHLDVNDEPLKSRIK